MAMEKKQKIILGLTIVSLGYLGYQLYELIAHDLSGQRVQVTSTSHATSIVKPGTTKANYQPVQKINIPKNNNQPILEKVNSQEEKPITLMRNQRQYLQLLNAYELARMKHQLLQEELAIAEAQQRIAKLTGNSDDSNTNVLSALADDGDIVDANDFSLSYVDQQNGRWSAMLHHAGHYETVYKNSLLTDGYRVLRINQSGVLLTKNKLRELLTFNGVIKLPPPQPKKIVTRSKPWAKNYKQKQAPVTKLNFPKISIVTSKPPALSDAHLSSGTPQLSPASSLIFHHPLVSVTPIDQSKIALPAMSTKQKTNPQVSTIHLPIRLTADNHLKSKEDHRIQKKLMGKVVSHQQVVEKKTHKHKKHISKKRKKFLLHKNKSKAVNPSKPKVKPINKNLKKMLMKRKSVQSKVSSVKLKSKKTLKIKLKHHKKHRSQKKKVVSIKTVKQRLINKPQLLPSKQHQQAVQRLTVDELLNSENVTGSHKVDLPKPEIKAPNYKVHDYNKKPAQKYLSLENLEKELNAKGIK